MSSDIVREAMLRVLTWRWRELAHRPVAAAASPVGAGAMLRLEPVATKLDLTRGRHLPRRRWDRVRRRRDLLQPVAIRVVPEHPRPVVRARRGRGPGDPGDLSRQSAVHLARSPRDDRRRELSLFIVFNLIGLGFSVATWWSPRRPRLDQSAGRQHLGQRHRPRPGALFRYWSYKKFVFEATPAVAQPAARLPVLTQRTNGAHRRRTSRSAEGSWPPGSRATTPGPRSGRCRGAAPFRRARTSGRPCAYDRGGCRAPRPVHTPRRPEDCLQASPPCGVQPLAGHHPVRRPVPPDLLTAQVLDDLTATEQILGQAPG